MTEPNLHDAATTPPMNGVHPLDALIGLDDETFADFLPTVIKPGKEGPHLDMLDQPRLAERFQALADEWAIFTILSLAQPDMYDVAVLFHEVVLARLHALAPKAFRGKFLPEARKLRGFAAFDLTGALKEWQHTHVLPGKKGKEGLQLPSISPVPLASEAWREKLQLTPKGDLKENISNIALVLRHHAAWKGRLWLDIVRERNMLNHQGETGKADAINDNTLANIGQWLADELRMNYAHRTYVQQAVDTVAAEQPRDLLQEWLAGLPEWDETPRLATWLQTCAGVDETAYAAFVSMILPVSMVARAMEPGCIYRYVVILEGPEEWRKSSIVSALASEEWLIEMSSSFEGKESHMMLAGAWVAELPELDSLTRTEEKRIKSFITTRADTFIPKWSNNRVSHPRRTIFVGTTNEKNYLKGETGNTRFLPIAIKRVIDIAQFVTDRQQIFAEALVFYLAHRESWWQMPFSAEAEAHGEREERRVSSVYEDELRVWLDHWIDPTDPSSIPTKRMSTTWTDIAVHFLKIDRDQWKDANLTRQIASSLRALGWEQRMCGPSGERYREWIRL